MDDHEKPKTAFTTGNGLFPFRVVKSRLCNTLATLEHLLENVLFGLPWDACLLYLDDIIVHGQAFREAVQRLRTLLQQLCVPGLKLSRKKCVFLHRLIPSVTFS